MSERVTLATTPDGVLVARKSGLGPGDARLRSEADLLRAARHPGVVTLVAEDPDGLTLGWVSGHALATTPQRTLTHAVALTIHVATTLADLHRIGITHGAVDASHILLDGAGRPVLCSFAEAARADSPVDPDHQVRADADVAALGAVLVDLLREVGPAAPGRWGRRRQHRAVTRLAERAADDPPGRRLSARAFAAALADAVPDARLPPPADVRPLDAGGFTAPRPSAPAPARNPAPAEAPHTEAPVTGEEGVVATHVLHEFDRLRPADAPAAPPSRPTPRAVVRLAALVGAAAAVLVVVRLGAAPPTPADGAPLAAPPPTRPLPDPPPTRPLPAPTTTRPTGSDQHPTDCTTTPDGSGTPSAGLDPSAGLHDTDGDGCVEQVLVDGNTVRVGSRHWRVGDADDLVAVADWDCDGIATPALLRPGSGEVFVFSSWAPPAGRVDVPATTVVPNGTALVAEPADCPRLVITRDDGTRLTLPTPLPTPETTP